MQVIASKLAGCAAAQVLHRLHAVIHLDPGFELVQARDLDQFRRQVDGGDLRALLGQRLAEQAAAAAHVQHRRTAQRQALGDVAQRAPG